MVPQNKLNNYFLFFDIVEGLLVRFRVNNVPIPRNIFIVRTVTAVFSN